MDRSEGPKGLEEVGQAYQVVNDVLEIAAANAATKSQQKAFKKIGSLWEKLDIMLGPSPRKLRNAEYIRLTDYCKYNDKWREYGKRPRTLAVLRWLGCPEAIDGFVRDNLSDIALPYTERNLPQCVKGQEMRTKFLELQQYVLTNQAADLERPGGLHLNIERSEQKYFDVIKPLGSGGFGTVDHVVSRLSLRQYALKRISRGQSFKRDRVAIRSFENELTSLKVLSHKHLVKLVGSYTDHDHIGLIITPVADMNLEEYLSAPEPDCPDRKNCIRQFFGCLAAGVEYLHAQKIRHKDIKPKNVLVLRNYRRVLLTDFGTAHNWSDDPGGSSSGTMHEAYTERYCAPEVFGRKMQDFFLSNGNGRHFVRENQQASEAWCQMIANRLTLRPDNQMLELGIRLCHPIPIERPTAAEIASEIVDFNGPVKYHCGCCELKSDHWTNLDIVQDMQNMTKTEEWTMTDTVIPEEASDDLCDEPSPISNVPDDPHERLLAGADQGLLVTDASANYQPPTVQEIQENMTVMYYDAEARPVCQPKDNHSDGPREPADIDQDTMVSKPTNISAEAQRSEGEGAIAVPAPKSLRLQCDWPNCEAIFTADDPADAATLALLAHCRESHGCHDYGRTMSLLRMQTFAKGQKTSQSALDLEPAQLVNYSVNSDATDIEPIVQRIHQARNDRQKKREMQIVQIAAAPAGTVSPGAFRPREGPGPQEFVAVVSSAKSSKKGPKSRKPEHGVRFGTLPEFQRPEPITLPVEETPYQQLEFDPQQILEEPLLEVFWPYLSHAFRNGSPNSSEAKTSTLPRTTFVPSFHLAAANRFSRSEVASSSALFVYGTLMFPSILNACAQHYISEDGVYSSKLQRRLRTSPSDWAFINQSVQNAAEKMTPAVISGYGAHTVKRRPWAFLMSTTQSIGQDHYQVSVPPEVHGFVVMGLSVEAYECLEHWHNEEMPSRLGVLHSKTSKSREGTQPNAHILFSHNRVNTYIELADQTSRRVAASIFMCVNHRYGTQIDPGHLELPQWDTNVFLRSPAFTQLGGGARSSTSEEKRLATTMNIQFLMRGDLLCSAVLQGETQKVLQYVDRGYDINAKCRIYGTALQAAAAKGEDDMARLLLEEGADVNASGGRYKSPLIAAVVRGDEEIAKLLLRHKANVLASGGQYINALYQAVSFSDIDMAHLLLERGAWLSENYLEVLDLAAEDGNRNMMRMLEDYDVRSLWKKRLLDQHSTDSGYETNDEVAYVPFDERRALAKPTTLSLVKAVVLEGFSLKGQRGKWTGIKAVRLLQVAMRMGASESIIQRAAPFLSSYEQLVKVICEASKQHTEEQRRLRHSGSSSEPRELENSDRRPGRSGGHSMTIPRPSTTNASNFYTDRNQANTTLDPSDTFCLTCNGRGGKAGTQRTCNECNGSTTVWKRQGTHSKRVTCHTCAGRGYTFSSRDVCRACNNGMGFSAAAAPVSSLTSSSTVRFEEDYDAPPPYTQ
ncbi:hypothetical protein H2200_011956 [Cladophialophora chaetospira]|uniref:Protein kinase domain-containing protein n=1 Tax=Cladophialophora chaetospira TaxID=386627 RepID=A0AA39CD02_9EURO|nr:hypothetical protein H2200_011956 [Cladophialophora chaetospira]